jgi:NADPH-dependent curcumin reductase
VTSQPQRAMNSAMSHSAQAPTRSPTQAQRITLARHIEGKPTLDDFRLETFALPPLNDGQFLVANHYVSADPGTRSRLSGTASYAGALAIGDVVDGFAVGQVIESLHPEFQVGDWVTLGSGWASHVVSKGRGYCAKLPTLDVPLSAWIGVLGVPGMTAWFGLKRVGQIKAGDRVLVTSAGGPVGATAGQLAKAWGAAQVVGVAGGGQDKTDWLMQEAGFDAVLDYRAPDFASLVAAQMPKGIDLLFDNVGNTMIDQLLPLMAPGGRIVVSGQVADYSLAPHQRHGIINTDRFITHRLKMEGLVVFDDLRAFPEAQLEAAQMISAGQLKLKEVISQGVESLPAAFCGLFQPGAAFGRRLAQLRV